MPKRRKTQVPPSRGSKQSRSPKRSERDMDQQTKLDLDPEDALRALLTPKRR